MCAYFNFDPHNFRQIKPKVEGFFQFQDESRTLFQFFPSGLGSSCSYQLLPFSTLSPLTQGSAIIRKAGHMARLRLMPRLVNFGGPEVYLLSRHLYQKKKESISKWLIANVHLSRKLN